MPSEIIWKKIGLVGRAHGLKGDFFIHRHNLLSRKHQNLIIGHTYKTGLNTKIILSKTYKQKTLLRVDKFHDRTTLEPYIGQTVWGDSSITDDPFVNFIGRILLDSNQQTIGTIRKFNHYGATHNMEIQAPSGATVEIPYCDTYFSNKDKPLSIQLACGKEVFDDFWYLPQQD